MPPAEWLSPPVNKTNNGKNPSSEELNKKGSAESDSAANKSGNKEYNVKRLYRRQNEKNTQIEKSHIANKTNSNFLKFAVDRAISIIKDEHLQKLHEHCLLIDAARSNQTKSNRDDRSRKIRDEQVKAISTIKQLTNDLKELTRLESQCKTADAQELLDRLDDTRSSLIRATNEFMLANEDINRIPALRSSPYSSRDQLDQLDESTQYDYCIDAKYISDSDTNEPGIQSQTQCDEKYIDDVVEQEMFLKLERDTLELRRLFGEFYEAVHRQRDRLDSIETNIIDTVEDITVGKQHLHKANRNLTVIVPITGCVAGALIGGPLGLVVGGKVGGLTIGCISTVLGFVTSYGAQKCVSL